MFVLVTGGSASGKSAWAEERLMAFGPGRRYYVATMQCFDEETAARISRHRSMRKGKGFDTIECPLDLAGLMLPLRRPGESCHVLLECLSNLAANEMFDPERGGPGAFGRIESGIDSLLKQCDNLVVVTNEIFSDGITYDPSTQAYMELLGRLNTALARRADEVTEVFCGVPLVIRPPAPQEGAAAQQERRGVLEDRGRRTC